VIVRKPRRGEARDPRDGQSGFVVPEPSRRVGDIVHDWLKLSKNIAKKAYARSIKTVSPDGLGKDSAIKNQLGLIKQTTGKEVKAEDVIDFTLLRQVLAELK